LKKLNMQGLGTRNVITRVLCKQARASRHSRECAESNRTGGDRGRGSLDQRLERQHGGAADGLRGQLVQRGVVDLRTRAKESKTEKVRD
jgi:hypothetical protein